MLDSVDTPLTPSPAEEIAQPAPAASISKGFFNVITLENFFIGLLSFFLTDPDLLKQGSRICTGIFWGSALLSIVGTMGFDTKPILSLFSICGLTFGLAAKDLLSNVMQGIFILFLRPFHRGDIIQIDGHKGRVLSVDVRYVKLRKMDDRSNILIPLANVYKGVLIIDK